MAKSSYSDSSFLGRIVNGKYIIEQMIGHGSFGVIFRARNIKTDKKVAIKMESVHAKRPLLFNEAKVYAQLCGGVGIPQMHYYGNEYDSYMLIIELLGPTLEDLFNICLRQFSMKTVLMIGDQTISRIEYLHNNFYVHRDIKPDNFLMGLSTAAMNRIFLVDFGLAKHYCDPQSQLHMKYHKKNRLIGTPRYASVNAHMGVELSRRDDMESMGYMLLYFCLGKLPWQGIKACSKQQKFETILEKKISTSLPSLCASVPLEFQIYMEYCRTMHFVEEPDYNFIRALFQKPFMNLNYHFDNKYDWLYLQIDEKSFAIEPESQTEKDDTSQTIVEIVD